MQYDCKDNGETIEDLTFQWPEGHGDEELDRGFDSGYGGEEGIPFFARSKRYVYFCICYDGSESVASVSIEPNLKQPPGHFGG